MMLERKGTYARSDRENSACSVWKELLWDVPPSSLANLQPPFGLCGRGPTASIESYSVPSTGTSHGGWNQVRLV